jgi:YesN/AraC family two-component response regulator
MMGVVLLIEDNKRLRETIENILSPYYELISTARGEETFKVLELKKVDLILLDIFLSSSIDGFDILRLIRNDSKFKNIPVIILSGLADEEAIHNALQLGANDYLVKPFSLTILLYKINNFIALIHSITEFSAISNLHVESFDKDSVSEKLKQLDMIIDEMISTDKYLGIKEIAKKMDLSVSSLVRLLNKKYRISPNRYIMKRRLEKANLLLMTGRLKIKEVAFHLGFSSVAYFTKCYKDLYGHSPKNTQVFSNKKHRPFIDM